MDLSVWAVRAPSPRAHEACLLKRKVLCERGDPFACGFMPIFLFNLIVVFRNKIGINIEYILVLMYKVIELWTE